MIKITCLNSSQFDELLYILTSKNIKHDTNPPKVEGRIFEKFSVIVDFDELIEVMNEGTVLR